MLKVREKIDENELKEEKQAFFLKRTLSNDVLAELSAMPDYDANLNNFKYLSKTLKHCMAKNNQLLVHMLNYLKSNNNRFNH